MKDELNPPHELLEKADTMALSDEELDMISGGKGLNPPCPDCGNLDTYLWLAPGSIKAVCKNPKCGKQWDGSEWFKEATQKLHNERRNTP